MAVGTPTTASAAASTNGTLAVPTGTAANDDTVVVIGDDGTSAETISLTGFSALVNSAQTTPDGERWWIGWKRQTSTPDSGSYTLSRNQTVVWAAAAMSVSGRDTVNPPVISATNTVTTTSSATASPTALTAVAGDDVLFIVIPDQSSGSITFSGWTLGFTEIADFGVALANIGIAKLENVAAGSLAPSVTMSATSAYSAWLVRLPVAGAASPRPHRSRLVGGGTAVQRASTWMKKSRGILVPDLWLPVPAGA